MTTGIVVCGNDRDLQRIRGLVLSQVGFSVSVAVGLSDLGSFDCYLTPALVVLCHSLSETQQKQCIEFVRTTWSKSKLILLSKADGGFSDPVITHFNTFEGPAKLVALARKLVLDDSGVIHGPAQG